jgi:hypothetical protein
LVYHVLITKKTAAKAKRFLGALISAGIERGLTITRGDEYAECDVLILYGLGGADRINIAAQHQARGKTFVAWDLGYWDRFTHDRKYRLAFNSNHPHDVMRGPVSPERIRMHSVSNPNGPILLIGHGRKSNAVWADGWVVEKLSELRRVFPGKQIVYRPKPINPLEVHTLPISYGAIDDALVGVSLVVCRHSNVAVDACRLGVPVVCDAGAAAEIYPQTLSDRHNQPSEDTRRAFLQRLALWQYSANEADQAWDFIQGKICV